MLTTSPAFGCGECLVPDMLRKAAPLREALKRRCDLVVDRKTRSNPSNSVQSPALTYVRSQGEGHELTEGNLASLGTGNAGGNQPIRQFSGHLRMWMLQNREQRHIIASVADCRPGIITRRDR